MNKFLKTQDEYYIGLAQSKLSRENGVSPSGVDFYNRWVLRDHNGVYVDHDKYINDIKERHGITTQDLLDYIKTSKHGEEVIETSISALFKTEGVIIIENGKTLVKWKPLNPNEGSMTTSITAGTRRISEVDVNMF